MKRPKSRITLHDPSDEFDDFGDVDHDVADDASTEQDDARSDEPGSPKKAIIIRMPEAARRRLRLLAVQRSTTVQDLMVEAIQLLGEKYKTDLL